MSKASLATTLQGPHNWDLWIYTVQKLAEAADVWDYIDPEASSVPELSKPERPTDPDPPVNADGSPSTEPNSAAHAQYTKDLSLYYIELKEYRRTKDKLGQIEAHIANTMAQDFIHQIKDQKSLHEQLKTLRELLSPSPADREYQVQKAYNSAKVLHARRENLED